MALTSDTGASASDKITSNGALHIEFPAEAGGTVQYSTNGGTTWTSSFSAVEGVNNVQVRQIDTAGNAGTQGRASASRVILRGQARRR